MTVLWTNDAVIFTDGDVVWKPHETDAQAISASVSNVSGSLNVATELIGSADGTSGAEASLDSQPGMGSSVVEISGVSASLGFLEVLTSFIVSVVGASGVSGSLNVATELIGSTDGIFSVDGSLTGIWTNEGSADGTSGTYGSLNVLTFLQGSTDGISVVSGFLNFVIELVSSADGVSGAEASLDSQPGMGSSVVEISGVSASLGLLEVLTSFTALVVGASNVFGSLNVATELISSTDGTSGAEASLDSQPGMGSSVVEISGVSASLGLLEVLTSLVASVAGASGVFGYLTSIPDFEAAILFWRPQDKIIETLQWNTSILQAHNGTEQRIKIRQLPRQFFRIQLVLETNKINTWFDSVIHAWQKSTWLIPIWTEYVEHLTDITVKDDSIIVDTTNADFRDGGKAIIWKSTTEYEVIVIDTKTDSQLNLSYSVLSSFTGNKYIIPVRTAYLVSSSKKEKFNSEFSIVNLIFAVYDNTEILEYIPNMVYDGLEVLDTPAFMGSTHSENSDGDIYIMDFETGIFSVKSNSDFNFLSQGHNFFNDSKAACWNFRKFLCSLNGRQKAILIPTFRDDLIQTDDIGLLDTFVNIENIQLADNMGFNSLRTYIGFYFSATDVLIVRKITAIIELDSIEEQITFDADLGLSFTVRSGDCKICFVDKCRLSSDKVEIQWPYAHRNECQTNFMRVP